MSKERLYLFGTTLRCPFARSREAREHEQTKKLPSRGFGGYRYE
jgi:hypothetical protein